MILEIADCSRRIKLEFEVGGDLHLENSLHKVDTLFDVLHRFREGLVVEAERYKARAS